MTFSLDFPIASIALWLVFLGLMMIPLRAFFELKRFLLPIVSLVLGIFALYLAHQNSEYNEEKPLQSNIFYALNHETESAFWVSNVLKPDDWNKQFFEKYNLNPLKEIYPYARTPRLKNEAKFIALPTPEVELLSDTLWQDGRIFTFRLKSMLGAENLQLYINRSSGLNSLEINGKRVTDSSFYSKPYQAYYMLNYFGWPREGIEFTLQCNSNQPIEILIYEKKLGLPDKLEFKPMPDWVVPQTGYESYLSLVKSKFSI